MLVGFWAFGAIAQAHADALPQRSSATQKARSAAHPPHLLRTARRPAAPLRTTLERVRPARLPPVTQEPKAADRPAADPRGAARRDPSGSSERRGGGCHPSPRPPHDPPTKLHRAVRHAAAKAAPVVRGHRHHTAAYRVTSPPQRIKPTGTITHTPRPRTERLALAAPAPAPVSGSGEGDCSGGKTSSGTGDASHISVPVSGLWSIAPQPAVTASRIIADKPSFSPD
jgi:hypothetical protein